MNRYLRYLQYNLTHEQISLVINNYFKFDTATGKLASQREQFCFCMYTYWHHLENLSYQTHTKLWVLKSSCEDTFSTKQLSKTIVACGMLKDKCSYYSVSFCSSIHIFSEAIICCPESTAFKEEAIFLPYILRNNYPLISQSIQILYL